MFFIGVFHAPYAGEDRRHLVEKVRYGPLQNDETQDAQILRNIAYMQYVPLSMGEAQRSRSRFSTAGYDSTPLSECSSKLQWITAWSKENCYTVTEKSETDTSEVRAHSAHGRSPSKEGPCGPKRPKRRFVKNHEGKVLLSKAPEGASLASDRPIVRKLPYIPD